MCDRIQVLINAALDQQLLFVIDPRHAGYMASGGQLTASAASLFPDAAWDIAEGAKCLALERFTGSVFHAMRALESVLDGLCAETSITPKNPNWENVLNDITGAVNKWDANTRGPDWQAHKQFYSAAVAHLRTCQRGWRNYVMHKHVTYDEPDARAILEGVKSFLNDFSMKP